MSKCLLLTLAILAMQVGVKACSDDGAARQKDARSQSLAERLSKSEYVVEKGELARRPDAPAAAAETSTPLSREEEFQVMKKALAAARARAEIADGSGLVLDNGEEYYEVVIGSPTPAGPRGPDHAAKVLVDKKTLAVARIVTNGMKNHDEEVARRVAQYRDLRERLSKSEYVVQGGELARRPDGVASAAVTPLGRDEDFQLMKKGLAAARSKLEVPDGSGVVLDDGKEHYEVVIGSPTPAGSLGPDYTAKVMVDKKTRAVVQILSGG